jgi:hypothetical protein
MKILFNFEMRNLPPRGRTLGSHLVQVEYSLVAHAQKIYLMLFVKYEIFSYA